MSTKIIVDSACDLTNEIIEQYQIEILPFNVHIEQEEFLDGKEIDTKKVYSAIKEGKNPTTSQVRPEIFESIFRKEAEKGNDCIYLSFSAKMSGAFQTGKLMAKEIMEQFKDIEIDVIDSKAGSAATGIIAYKAAQMLSKGETKERVIEGINFWVKHIEHIFVLDDLKQLQRGGRISKTKSFIGNILNIKPLLHVNDGEIELLTKVRGTKKSINKLVQLLQEKSYDIKNQLIAITHADDLEKAKDLQEKIQDLGGEIFCLEMIGGVLGTHLGIGGIGVFFLNKAWN